jgi:hypothetical protein
VVEHPADDDFATEIDWEESDAVWDSVPGAERLWLLYGYFPRFTSARLVSLRLSERALTATFYLIEPVADGYDADPPSGEPESSLAHAVVTLSWTDVESLSSFHTDNELEALWFERAQERLLTRFRDPGSGLEGQIRAESVAVVDVQRPLEAGFLPGSDDRMSGTLEISWLP